MIKLRITIAALGLLLALPAWGGTLRFRSDDPLMEDPDRLPVPQPAPREISQIFDFLENTFLLRQDRDNPTPTAVNVNTLGQVPDSSWYTNRISLHEMSLEALRRGPNRLEGPDLSRPWLVAGIKTEGVTPGLTIRDARDDLYFIKFDPPENLHLTTSAEVIATKFFHAFGYNVPENYLAFIRRQDLIVSPQEGHCDELCEVRGHDHRRAVFVDEEGKERALEQTDLDRIFEAYFSGIDRVPVIASLRLEGIPLGPFEYFGTRSDDPNDVFPHQDRRELRGLRVFSAWLNHDDSRSINSLDMYVGDPGQGHVVHHLIDFGSTLGSGSIKVQSRRAGNEYILEWAPLWKAAVSFGIWDRAWRHVDYPNYPSIGRFEADFFQPERWKPEYPNPAFQRMRLDDAFWATRIIAKFSDEKIRAIVETGRLPDPKAEDYLVETLIRRRDKILSHYLSRINPLDRFEVKGNRVEFVNLGEEKGRLAQSSSYSYEWFSFDNLQGTLDPVGQEGVLPASSLPSLPIIRADGQEYLMVRLRTLNREREAWAKAVDIYLDMSAPQPRIVGIDREI